MNGKAAAHDWRDVERARLRRQIEAWEVPHLKRLGRELHRIRRAGGLTQLRLAVAAELSPRHLARIELGYRRTRRSTLERIARAWVEGVSGRGVPVQAQPELGPVNALTDRLGVEPARPRRTPEPSSESSHERAAHDVD